MLRVIACGISNPSGKNLSARNTHYALLILTSSVSSILFICTLSVVPASQNTSAPFLDISVTEDLKMDAQSGVNGGCSNVRYFSETTISRLFRRTVTR